MVEDIRFEDFHVEFPGKDGTATVANHISVTFEKGKITGLIGESGSGKSILGMSILRLIPGSAKVHGHCYYGDEDLFLVDMKRMRQIRGKEIAVIPQNPSEALNPIRKIGNQLTEALLEHHLLQKKPAQERVSQILSCFGFQEANEIMSKYSFEMSGGMNQRVISVLGLACKPNWLIADEPTKGLDAIVRNQVLDVLKKAAKETTGSMLVITHDLKLAERLCDNICVLYAGNILEQGKGKEIFEEPKHPYTQGLFLSMPDRGMHPIKGYASERNGAINRCPFAERCSYKMDICEAEFPPEISISETRKVRCFLYA